MTKSHAQLYLLAVALSLLAVLYCVGVYNAGQVGGLALGGRMLTGIPNYYLFYPLILPFVCAAMVHLGLRNRLIRFVGPLDPELPERQRAKVQRFRRLLPALCVLFSVLVIAQDAADKDHSLAPYAYAFADNAQRTAVTRQYASLQGWIDVPGADSTDPESAYLKVLRDNGIQVDSTQGFASVGQWWQHASWLYRFESLLSLLAALVISLLLAQVFLLMLVKDRTRPATRNLMIWVLILASFWFPTKIYATWHASLQAFQPPGVLLFGLLVLVLGALLIFFIKSERNDLAKYGALITGLFSVVLSGLSYIKPDMLHRAVELLRDSGIVYSGIFAVLVVIALYLVTDYFICCYEEEINGGETES